MKHMENIHEEMVSRQQKGVVLGLIQELQQYMMSINSGRTDCSMYNSDTLESIETLVMSDKMQLHDAIKKVCAFAKLKLDMNLSEK